jgi:hypothetical protein
MGWPTGQNLTTEWPPKRPSCASGHQDIAMAGAEAMQRFGTQRGLIWAKNVYPASSPEADWLRLQTLPRKIRCCPGEGAAPRAFTVKPEMAPYDFQAVGTSAGKADWCGDRDQRSPARRRC